MSEPTRVQRATADHFRIPVDSLCSRTTIQRLVVARHIAWYLERKEGLSFPMIAELYGRRDHSGIITGVNHVRERLAALDARYAPDIAVIEAKLELALHRGQTLIACPTCGTSITDLRMQMNAMQQKIDQLLGAKS